MTRQEFREQYPTPAYVKEAWDAMHANRDASRLTELMLAWEAACHRARGECDAAYGKQFGAKPWFDE